MRGRGGEVQSQQMHCETGLLDVEGEMENLSAKVVNLFLASFSEEKKKKGKEKQRGNSLRVTPLA